MVEKVRIPERFREPLKERFDLRRIRNVQSAEDFRISYYTLSTECPLCEYYKNRTGSLVCAGCPFGPVLNGCVFWIRNLLGISFVDPFKSYHKGILRDRIRRIKKEAPEFIEWIKDE